MSLYWNDNPNLSRFAQKVDRWYNFDHFWTLTMVKNAVKKGKITKEEYAIITGYDYDTGEKIEPEETVGDVVEETSSEETEKTTTKK